MKGFLNALIAAVCMQTAVLAGYGGYKAAAAMLWIVAGIVIVQSIKEGGGGIRRRTKRKLRDALATIMLVSGLLRFFILQVPFGGRDKLDVPLPKKASASARGKEGTSDSLDNSGDHTGIILLPEREQRTTLVPPLPSMSSALFDTRHRNPITIPFYGAYWFFKLPDLKPPPSSYVTHGTPAEMTFFAPDSRPLIMEAHQNLGKLISLSCCRAIQIELENADRFPGTVSVELELTNTREGQQGSVSLGGAPVTSDPTQVGPMKETLTFKIPAHTSIEQFDELTIRFPRRRSRISRSAKVAIQRFVLMPR